MSPSHLAKGGSLKGPSLRSLIQSRTSAHSGLKCNAAGDSITLSIIPITDYELCSQHRRPRRKREQTSGRGVVGDFIPDNDGRIPRCVSASPATRCEQVLSLVQASTTDKPCQRSQANPAGKTRQSREVSKGICLKPPSFLNKLNFDQFASSLAFLNKICKYKLFPVIMEIATKRDNQTTNEHSNELRWLCV